MACRETFYSEILFLKKINSYFMPCKYSICVLFSSFCSITPALATSSPSISHSFFSSLPSLIVLGRNIILLFLSPRTVSSHSSKSLIKPSPSEYEHTLCLLSFSLRFPTLLVPAATTLELQVPTLVSNIGYFAVPPTRELKMPLITLSPISPLLCNSDAAQQCSLPDSPL